MEQVVTGDREQESGACPRMTSRFPGAGTTFALLNLWASQLPSQMTLSRAQETHPNQPTPRLLLVWEEQSPTG